MSNDINTLIAGRLKERRLAAGIKLQREAAEQLRIGWSRYKNYEQAIRIPPLEVIADIAELYDCNPAYLVGWVNNPERTADYKTDRRHR